MLEPSCRSKSMLKLHVALQQSGFVENSPVSPYPLNLGGADSPLNFGVVCLKPLVYRIWLIQWVNLTP